MPRGPGSEYSRSRRSSRKVPSILRRRSRKRRSRSCWSLRVSSSAGKTLATGGWKITGGGTGDKSGGGRRGIGGFVLRRRGVLLRRVAPRCAGRGRCDRGGGFVWK